MCFSVGGNGCKSTEHDGLVSASETVMASNKQLSYM